MTLLVIVAVLAVLSAVVVALASRSRDEVRGAVRSFSEFLDALTPAVSALSADTARVAAQRRAREPRR